MQGSSETLNSSTPLIRSSDWHKDHSSILQSCFPVSQETMPTHQAIELQDISGNEYKSEKRTGMCANKNSMQMQDTNLDSLCPVVNEDTACYGEGSDCDSAAPTSTATSVDKSKCIWQKVTCSEQRQSSSQDTNHVDISDVVIHINADSEGSEVSTAKEKQTNVASRSSSSELKSSVPDNQRVPTKSNTCENCGQELKVNKSKDIESTQMESENSLFSLNQSTADFCRICHCESDNEIGPLIAPCRCKGTLAYVHHSCLQQWIKSSGYKHCELCGFHFAMDSKLKPITKWEKLSMSTSERRKIICSVMFHIIIITCVVWSLYVLIDRTANELKSGKLLWPFWTKLVVVAIGFTGGLVFMYVQCKVYVQLWRRLKAFNRIIYVQNQPPNISGTSSTPSCGKPPGDNSAGCSDATPSCSRDDSNVVVVDICDPDSKKQACV